MKRIKIYLLMLLAALTVGSCGSDNEVLVGTTVKLAVAVELSIRIKTSML